MDKGFFEAEKLTIEPAVAEGGAAVVPAVMSGDNQIGFSNVTSLMIAKEQNLPLKPIAAGVNARRERGRGLGRAAVAQGRRRPTSRRSRARRCRSTRSRTCRRSRSATRSIRPAWTRRRCEFVEIPFPDVPAALEAKRVDAAFAVEPFVGASSAIGARSSPTPFEEVAPDLTIAEYFTTEKYAQENADVVERFQRAMNKSLEFASQNPDEVRRIITTYTKTPAGGRREDDASDVEHGGQRARP